MTFDVRPLRVRREPTPPLRGDDTKIPMPGRWIIMFPGPGGTVAEAVARTAVHAGRDTMPVTPLEVPVGWPE